MFKTEHDKIKYFKGKRRKLRKAIHSLIMNDIEFINRQNFIEIVANEIKNAAGRVSGETAFLCALNNKFAELHSKEMLRYRYAFEFAYDGRDIQKYTNRYKKPWMYSGLYKLGRRTCIVFVNTKYNVVSDTSARDFMYL